MGNAKWYEQRIERFQQSGKVGSGGRKGKGRKRKGGRAAKPSKPFQMPEPMRKSNESEGEFDLRRTNTTADFLRMQGKLPEAEPLFRQVIDMTKKLFPLNHDRVVEAIETYAEVLRQLGRTEEAKSYKALGKILRLRQTVPTATIQEIKSEPETLPVTSCVEKPPPADVSPAAAISPLIELSDLKTALVHLGYAIKWEAMELIWGNRREWWLTEVYAAYRVNDLARSIAVLEQHVTPESFENGWSEIRKNWIEECQQASTIKRLIKALLDLEAYISREAVRDDWADVRACWPGMIQWNDPN